MNATKDYPIIAAPELLRLSDIFHVSLCAVTATALIRLRASPGLQLPSIGIRIP